MSVAGSEPAGRRLSTALKAQLESLGVRVEDLVVLPQAQGLVVQWTNEAGNFQQASLNDAAWYAKFRQDESSFVRSLAEGLPRRIPDTLWSAKGELDLQYLFVRVIGDLDTISKSTDDYANLRVASLLRLLLLDDPLIHKVNRVHRLPVTFFVGYTLVNDIVDPDNPSPGNPPRLVKVRDGRLFHAAGDSFDPQHHRGAAREFPLAELLKALVVKVEEHFVSVHEFVSHMAYVEGLVHYGQPKDKRPADHDLQRWRRMLALDGRGPLLATLAAIGRVVVTGAVPLAYECERAIREGRSMFNEQTGPK